MDPNAKSWWRFATLILALAIAFGFAAPGYVRRYSIPARSVVSIYGCFLLLVILIAIPGARGSREWIATRLGGRNKPLILIGLWCVPYLIYSAGTGDFRWIALLRLLAIAVPLVTIYLAWPVRNSSKLCWQDVLAGVWLMTAVLSHQLKGIWNVPVNLDFMGRLFLIAVASWCWVFVRVVPGLGYEFSISRRVLKAAAWNFACFAVIAIPAGLAMHFTQWNPQWRGVWTFCLEYLEIFLFIAWLEELFFRGFLQSLLSNSLGTAWRGQLLASCLFGLTHILHAPVPNWRYVILASVAGWFYGSAFRSGGNLVACALTHALVDTAWRTWFARA